MKNEKWNTILGISNLLVLIILCLWNWSKRSSRKKKRNKNKIFSIETPNGYNY